MAGNPSFEEFLQQLTKSQEMIANVQSSVTDVKHKETLGLFLSELKKARAEMEEAHPIGMDALETARAENQAAMRATRIKSVQLLQDLEAMPSQPWSGGTPAQIPDVPAVPPMPEAAPPVNPNLGKELRRKLLERFVPLTKAAPKKEYVTTLEDEGSVRGMAFEEWSEKESAVPPKAAAPPAPPGAAPPPAAAKKPTLDPKKTFRSAPKPAPAPKPAKPAKGKDEDIWDDLSQMDRNT